MSDAMAALPKDDPRIVAWEAYRAGPHYQNTRNWALHEEYVDGSLWAAFLAGYMAQAALLEQAEAALERSAKAGQRVLDAMDDYNEKHGTYLGGPAYFEIGRAVAQNRALLAKLREGGE